MKHFSLPSGIRWLVWTQVVRVVRVRYRIFGEQNVQMRDPDADHAVRPWAYHPQVVAYGDLDHSCRL